ncbi:MAG TPA: sulfatase-like hydrolase/transferase [Gemmataceae bacterium]|jgi:arylsulfatase A-like enzyme
MKSLIITVRGLRADSLGCYGNDWIDAPNLEKLAAESVVFDQHFADQPNVEGAFAAWRTGDHGFLRSLTLPARPDILKILAAAPVETRLIGDESVWPPLPFAAEFKKALRVHGGPTPGASLEPILEAARKAIVSLNRREHVLLWVDLPALLPPWEIPEEFLDLYFPEGANADEAEEQEDEESLAPWKGAAPLTVAPEDDATLLRLQRTYAAAVSELDAHLGRLLETMSEKGWMQDWLVAITAPFGLPLGDHGAVGAHRPWLHEELVHVPLLLHLPGGAAAGMRVSGLTLCVDIPATVLDAMALPLPAMMGQSLLPLCRSEKKSVHSEIYTAMRSNDAEEWALRTREWSFLLPVRIPDDDAPRSPQLYVKPDDRHEVNNVVQHHSELAEEMERKLRLWGGSASVEA